MAPPRAPALSHTHSATYLLLTLAFTLPRWAAAAEAGAAGGPGPWSSRCVAGCTVHGTCNEELGRCDCPRHLEGPACDQPVAGPLRRVCQRYGFEGNECGAGETPFWCLNNCTARGTCRSGWCHCQPGYFGADCSLSLDAATGQVVQLEGMGYHLAPHGPYVYVYELPPRFNTWYNVEKMDRPLCVQLWKRLVSSGHRTVDPAQADYFFVPVDFRYTTREARKVLQYVWQTWPHWNHTGGARHLLLSTSDLGACEGKALMGLRNATRNATWLTAWGLTRKHPKVWWTGCHRPGQDLVIPIPVRIPGMLATPLNVAAPPPMRPERNITFFFAGKICGDNLEPKPPGSPWPICTTSTNPLYSAGMRQQVYAHHAHRPGYRILTRTPTYKEDMSRAIFCLAPTGGGHGNRNVLVTRFGCIPVPITDFVLQPFEPELPWEEFSVPVLERDVPHLHNVLGALSPARVAAMQRSLACQARHMWWSTMWGSLFGEDGRYDAFATLMEVLGARTRHPGARAQDLIHLDKRFARFARCQLGDDTEATRRLMQDIHEGQAKSPPLPLEREEAQQQATSSGPGKQLSPAGRTQRGKKGPVRGSGAVTGNGTTPVYLCYYALLPQHAPLAPTGMCQLHKWRKYGVPGGVVCEGAPNIAQCPRPWE